MSDQKDKELLSSLHALREALSAHADQVLDASEYVSLSQSFDRLYLGYQSGAYTPEQTREGMSEIRARLSGDATSSRVLVPSMSTRRDAVLVRNYRDLATRLLDESRGSWDSRHVEIVQGAISHLAGTSEGASVARALQSRMSESVWLGGLELADSLSEIAQETSELQNSLWEALGERTSGERREMSAGETPRELAVSESMPSQAEVRRAVEQARLQAWRNESESLKSARRHVDALAMKVAQERLVAEQNAQKETERRAVQSLMDAAQRVVASEYRRLGDIYRQAVANAGPQASSQERQALFHGIEASMQGDTSRMSAEELRGYARHARESLSALADKSPAVKQAIRDIERLDARARVMAEMDRPAPSSSVPDQESEDSRDAMLQARLFFDQKRLQFERHASDMPETANLLKALDYEMPVSAEPAQKSGYGRTLEQIKRVRQIAQSAFSGDIGMYAPTAGAEYTRNVSSALHMADKAVPVPSAMPTLQSSLAQRSNRVLRDVKQLAFLPSVRSDMGFTTPKTQIEPSAKPLFKRVRFSQDNPEVNEMLPSLYRIAGLKMAEQKGASPLRKSHFDLDLRGANLEIVKIIENQFDSGVRGRQTEQVSGASFDASQRQPDSSDPHNRALGIISDWIDSHHDSRRMAADTKSLIQTGRMKGGHIETALKGEAMTLPASVQEKLSPFLNFDLSKIKVYSGPVAAMASEAMGAHAFTLGQSIFLGKNKLDFSTPEGLGLLAHELLHTSHFSSGSSVESKEQEAEAMEARVKSAFGNGSPTLALEKTTDKKSNDQVDTRNSKTGMLKPNSVGAVYRHDPDYVFDFVCDIVFDRLIEEVRLERERNGEDR